MSHTSKSCSDEDMRKMLDGILFIDSLKYNVLNKDTINGSDVYHMVCKTWTLTIDIDELCFASLQDESVSSFVEKLQHKMQQLYSSEGNFSDINSTFLRQSRAAAGYDAVILLALALNHTQDYDKSCNYSQTLNSTLSNLKLNGMAVSNIVIVTMSTVWNSCYNDYARLV